MKVTICDRCGSRISDKPYRILLGRYSSNSRIMPEEFSKALKDYDLCEECAKEISELTRNKTIRATVDEKKVERQPSNKAPAEKQVKKKSTKKLNIDIKDIMALRNQGVSYKEIANELGCSEGTIFDRIKKYNKLQEAAANLDKGKISALWKTGTWSIKDIAEEMKTSEAMIRAALQDS